MKRFLIGLIVFGFSPLLFAQVEELSEVTIYATNYKYLNDVNSQEVASIPVRDLERKVANFDVKESEFYHDDYDEYIISFYIPQGKILAAYDRDGKIIRTAERFENVNVPLAVKNAIVGKFPGWKITEDIYKVTFYDTRGSSKTYKLKLDNGVKTMRVKLDENGNFL